MKLINARTFELETFTDTNRPNYAILSHRWQHGEVTFDDMLKPGRQQLSGWTKIQLCCQQALVDGLEHVWVDTCCIDKSSSAELSEAINSMFTWYSGADRCYAYLSDVTDTYTKFDINSENWMPTLPDKMATEIIGSLWFTRAWTLQELIAPPHLTFYNAFFRELCTKVEIAKQIEETHKVPCDVLLNRNRLWTIPVAVKLSWAAHRKATRTEDIAYSLFGIFNVNLPLLYGEGKKAFTRLQEEIIRQTHDHSIFVWSSTNELQFKASQTTMALPLLANSPRDFEACQHVFTRSDDDDIRPYALTNIGLEIELRIFPYDLDVYAALLHCWNRNGQQYAFLITKNSRRGSRWSRARVKGVDKIVFVDIDTWRHFDWQKMYIIKATNNAHMSTTCQNTQDTYAPFTSFYGLHLNAPELLTYSADTGRPYCLIAYNDWDYTPYRLETIEDKYRHVQSGYKAYLEAKDQQRSRDPKIAMAVLGMPHLTTGTAGIVAFDHLIYGIRAIKAGFDFSFRPIVIIATHEAQFDARLQTWLRSHRHYPLKYIGKRSYSMIDSLEVGEGTRLWDSQFWSQELDSVGLNSDHTICEDGHIKIEKGVYAFTSTHADASHHWIFKPYENQAFHLAIGLVKQWGDELVYWEVSIQKRNDPIKLDIEAVP